MFPALSYLTLQEMKYPFQGLRKQKYMFEFSSILVYRCPYLVSVSDCKAHRSHRDVVLLYANSTFFVGSYFPTQMCSGEVLDNVMK